MLVVIPDGTRTAPIPLMFALLGDLLGSKVEALDYLIALGTHPPMDDDAKGRSARDVGGRRDGGRRSRIFNHRWELDGDLRDPRHDPGRRGSRRRATVSSKSTSPVRLNQLVGDADGEHRRTTSILVCGPVFPHEVAGFSGGNKYFVPGVAGQEVIDVTHWVGALGDQPRDHRRARHSGATAHRPRRVLHPDTAELSSPWSCTGRICTVSLSGDMEEAWRAATELSAELDIVWVDRPFQRVLSVMPEMYDDLWTGAKGMYKLEPAIADGGEVVIYAPHITEVSYVHGHYLDEIGYHVRDYFTAQWERFKHIPWGVLAHSTHLRGDGTYVDGVEKPRIRVTLATGIPRERCETHRSRLPRPGVASISKSGRTARTRAFLLVRQGGRTAVPGARTTAETIISGGGAMTEKADIGLIGLAVMGQNLVLNMNDHGFKVAVFNRTVVEVDEFLEGNAKGTEDRRRPLARGAGRRARDAAAGHAAGQGRASRWTTSSSS